MNELYTNKEFETSDTWKSFYSHNPVGDYHFIILENYMSQENELPLWKEIPLRIYFFLKRIDISTEKAYNLDYSQVTTEKVPLVFGSTAVKLKRIII